MIDAWAFTGYHHAPGCVAVHGWTDDDADGSACPDAQPSEAAAARQRARARAADAIDTAGDFVQRTRKPGDRA